jgi:hypothetical protein
MTWRRVAVVVALTLAAGCANGGTDWNHADMEVFWAKLRKLSQGYRLELGPPATPVDSGC